MEHCNIWRDGSTEEIKKQFRLNFLNMNPYLELGPHASPKSITGAANISSAFLALSSSQLVPHSTILGKKPYFFLQFLSLDIRMRRIFTNKISTKLTKSKYAVMT